MPGGATAVENGLKFEEMAMMKEEGINISKHKMYKFLEDNGVDWKSLISRKILPDNVFVKDNKVKIYEDKAQYSEGSVDEKLQTAPYKIHILKRLFAPMGITDITYTYVLNDWFKQPKYKDVLDYIKATPNCDYIFASEKG